MGQCFNPKQVLDVPQFANRKRNYAATCLAPATCFKRDSDANLMEIAILRGR